jgi:hypothetical protein
MMRSNVLIIHHSSFRVHHFSQALTEGAGLPANSSPEGFA